MSLLPPVQSSCYAWVRESTGRNGRVGSCSIQLVDHAQTVESEPGRKDLDHRRLASDYLGESSCADDFGLGTKLLPETGDHSLHQTDIAEEQA